MKSKNTVKFITILLLLILLLIGGWMLYSMRYQGSDIYPYYSTFRSDRMGTKVLYESLKSFSEFKVKRNLRPLVELKDNKELCLLVLGCHPGSLETDFKEIEDSALTGERIIVSFKPKMREVKKKKPQKKKKMVIGKRKSGASGIVLRHLDREIKLPSKAIAEASLSVPDFKVFSRNCFELKRKDWKVLFTLKGKPLIVEKSYSGGGSIVLCADSYMFSNEALAGEHNAELLLFLLKGRQNIVFDETHLGAAKTRNIVWLAKRYKLLPFLLAAAITLLLFIWRSLLVPYNSSENNDDDFSPADFSNSSLVNMLRANYPVKALIKECWNEFRACRLCKTMSKQKYTALKDITMETGKSVDIYNNAVNEYKQREGLKDD